MDQSRELTPSSDSAESCIVVGGASTVHESSTRPTSAASSRESVLDKLTTANKRRSSRISESTTHSILVDKPKSGRLVAAVSSTTTTTVLGKRGRSSVKNLRKNAKVKSLRPRKDDGTAVVEAPQVEEEPPRKKTRLAVAKETQETKKPNVTLPKANQKKWLGAGLYVGQAHDFDPRMTSVKNKQKKASQAKPSRSRSALPLPMFAGARLLERGRPFKLPFDVFSPLPPGQPKPEEWRKTQSNRFFGDAASEWRKIAPLPPSRCICSPEGGCDEACLNRYMLYECDESNCNIGAGHCTNRSFADLKERVKSGSKYHIGVEVLKTLDKGFGVRACRTFDPHQIIVEYAGEIITQEECERRMNEEYKDAECYYLMNFDQNMIIDATRGSIARFVNHSCEPNCKMVKWIVAGKPRMALFAGAKGIMTGEELTYDYCQTENFLWGKDCRCGAPSCRGTLAPKDEKPTSAKRGSTASSSKAKASKARLANKENLPSLAKQARKVTSTKRSMAKPLRSRTSIKRVTKPKRAKRWGSEHPLAGSMQILKRMGL